MFLQIIQYVPARALPGIINFIAVAVYTRLLTPAEYGRYMFVMGVATLMQTVFFHWLRTGLQRFYHRSVREQTLVNLFSTITLGLLLSVAAAGITWFGLVAWSGWDGTLVAAMWLGLAVLVAEAMFQLTLERRRMELMPIRYGLLATIRAISGFVIGVSLVLLTDLKELGVLIGVAVSGLLSCALDGAKVPEVRLKQVRIDLLNEILSYGLPLTVSAVFRFVISTSDRLMLQFFLGDDAVGLYSAPYDLAQHTMVMLFIVISLAGFPVVVQALENDGVAAAQERLRVYGAVFFALAIPLSVGFAALSPVISEVLLGTQFRESALQIMPWISIATMVLGLKGNFFDLSFQLGKRTTIQIWPVAVGAIANVALNFTLIPRLGVAGAVYASVIAVVLSLGLSIWLGARIFPVPIPVSEIAGSLASSAFMAAVLRLLPLKPSWISLTILVVSGAVVYLLSMYALNVGNIRRHVRSWRRTARGSRVG